MSDPEMTDLPIPQTWAEITPEWMTSALSPSFPGVEVASVELLLVDDGTNRRARFGLTHAGEAGPDTVFLKASDPDHVQLNLATGGLFNEPRLFNTDIQLPVDHPAQYRALIDEPGLDFLLVMEDITTRGGDPRDSTRPLTIDQASDGVRGLARLHSTFWGARIDDHPRLGWVEPLVAWKGVMGGGITMGLERLSDTVPPEVRALDGDRVEALWCDYIDTMATGPHTLLHGDAHIGNTYVLPDDSVGFLDWQVLRRGNHALDLGYFLQGAVTTEDRRACEADLIDVYHDALDLPGDERPVRDTIWLRYRASVAHGLALWMATASGDTWQRPEISRALAERYAAAYVDLDTPSAVAELGRR